MLLLAVTSIEEIKTIFAKAQMKQCSGTLVKNGDNWFLHVDKNQEPQLFFHPEDQSIIDSLKWADGNQISIAGLAIKRQYLVTTIFTEKDTIFLRDALTNKQTAETTNKKWEVIPDKCISCGLCLKVCPVEAITFVKGKAVIDKTKCINCGMCSHGGIKTRGCPTNAIVKK
jgi:ferredoxin